MAERYDKPILSPAFDYESHGLEGPRIVKIDDLHYLTYTAYDGVHAQGALASVTNACFDLWAKKRGLPLWKLKKGGY